MAIGELCKEHGDEYEMFCMDPDDQGNMLHFYASLRCA